MSSLKQKRVIKIINHFRRIPTVNNDTLYPSLTNGDALVSLIHGHIIRYIIKCGYAPSIKTLTYLCNESETNILKGIKELENIHGIVLHPDPSKLNVNNPKIWVIHPFQLTPTLFYVTLLNNTNDNNNIGWYAPCIWCACGITKLIGGDSKIYTKLNGEKDALIMTVKNMKLMDNNLNIKDLYCHFGISVQNAWDNVHHFCSIALVFDGKGSIQNWCNKRGYCVGNIEHIDKILKLGDIWYGKHADLNWKKWTINEAKKIFNSVGLTHDIWKLPDQDDTF